MTVGELRNKLAKLPEDLPVLYFTPDNGFEEVYEAEKITDKPKVSAGDGFDFYSTDMGRVLQYCDAFVRIG